MNDTMCYSTLAGELPKLVENEVPMCFAKWEDYVELQRKYEELLAKYSEV